MYSAKIRHLSAPFPADKYIYCTYCTLKEHNYHTLQQTTFGENLKIFGKIMQKNANKKINNTKKHNAVDLVILNSEMPWIVLSRNVVIHTSKNLKIPKG